MATIKQQKAVRIMSETMRNSTSKPIKMGQILKQAGYSESVSKTPQRVTQTKGWNELMQIYVDDEFMIKKLRKLFDSSNPMMVAKAIDMTCKLKGYYKTNPAIGERSIYEDMTIEELDAEEERLNRLLNIQKK
jgi:hypothetical protein